MFCGVCRRDDELGVNHQLTPRLKIDGICERELVLNLDVFTSQTVEDHYVITLSSD